MDDTRPSAPALAIDITTGAADVVAAIRDGGLEPAAVSHTLGRLVRDPDALESALGADHRAGITTLEATHDLTVLRIVWPAGVRIPAHDHRMWAVVGVYRGSEDNLLFRRTEDGIRNAGDHRVDAGGTLVLGHEAVHAVANPHAGPCVALHVYGGDLARAPRATWDSSGRQRLYDSETLNRTLGLVREQEDHLGRPLRPAETRAVLARPH